MVLSGLDITMDQFEKEDKGVTFGEDHGEQSKTTKQAPCM
jgi:hypothetical protein